jgi:3-hydroxyisobutyrate dehydrogenase-like beta-hydroxyacid dehydrogenase
LQTSKDILNQTDIISLSLPSEEVCENLLFGKESGIVYNLKNPDKHRIIMDHSTYSKTFVTHCAKQAKLHGNISFVDAPVSGGPQGKNTI